MLQLTVGTKCVGLSLLSLLLVLLAGMAGLFELQRLSQHTVRLASSAQAAQYAQALRLDLMAMHRALAEGVARKDAVWFGQPLQQPRTAIDTNVQGLIRLLNEQGMVERANTVQELHITLNTAIDTLLSRTSVNNWNIAYLDLSNQVEPVEELFGTQIDNINQELRQEVIAATMVATETERSVLGNLTIIVVTAVLILGVTSWLLWRSLVQPLRHLTTTARILARGNLAIRATTNRRTDEIGTLAQAFNTMADELAMTYQRMEQTIATRTCELETERTTLQKMLVKLQANTAEREQLLKTLEELQHPVIPIVDGVVVTPIVGHMTRQRLDQLQTTLLEMVVVSHTRIALIDITGVPVIDAHAAHHLVQMSQALQLVGTTTIVVGISPEVAQSLISLGTTAQQIMTAVDLQRGVLLALRMLRRQIVNLDLVTADSRRAALV